MQRLFEKEEARCMQQSDKYQQINYEQNNKNAATFSDGQFFPQGKKCRHECLKSGDEDFRRQQIKGQIH